MKLLAGLVALVLAFSALWYVGDGHRQRCVDEGLAGCSVWPWAYGHQTEQQKEDEMVRRALGQ